MTKRQPSQAIAGLTAALALGCLGVLSGAIDVPEGEAGGTGRVPASATDAVERAYARLPLRFEENRGQTDQGVRFLSRGPGSSLFLTRREAVLSLTRDRPRGQGGSAGAVVRMRMAGANPEPVIRGAGRLPGRSNYIVGSDRSKWRTGVEGFREVRYRSVYPATDVVYHGRRGALEYDLELAPGADPSRIALDFSGARRLAVDRRGDLILDTPAGKIRQKAPVSYQSIGGLKRPVRSRYALEGPNRVGFRVGAYDRSRPLVIDPVLTYSTYLGGDAEDSGHGIGVDTAGNAYVTGRTLSPRFPTTDAARQKEFGGGGSDAFVAKLNPAGSALVYATYLGGSGDEGGAGIAVEPSGSAYVAGVTSSSNFPATPGAYKTTGGGAFVAKLNPSGSGLAYSTLVGAATTVGGVAVDPSGSASLTGQTSSSSFPTKDGYQASQPGGSDAFVTKLNPDGSALAYSTYFGGSGSPDSGSAIAVDSSGNAYLTGVTHSSNFPTQGSIPGQGAHGGQGDAFVAKLNTTAKGAASLLYSTYLGGSAGDFGYGIAVESGRAYVTGSTQSSGFPTTAGAYQASKPQAAGRCYDPRVALPNSVPCANAFVTKLSPEGSALDYSTYLGGTGGQRLAPVVNECRHRDCDPALVTSGTPGCQWEGCNRGTDFGYGIAVDASGKAYVAGRTVSADFPTVGDSLTRFGGGDCRTTQQASQYRPPAACTDAFVSKLDTTASGPGSLLYSGYLAGNRDDWANAVAVDGSGNAYLTGQTDSNDLPTVNALQPDPGGDQPSTDAMIAKVTPAQPATPTVTAVQPRGGPTSGGTRVVIKGARLGGTSAVRFGDTPASGVQVDPAGGQVTAISPPHVVGRAFVTVTNGNGTSPRASGAAFYYGEGGWSTTGSPASGRYGGHSATLLPNGKVLVTGGCCDASGQPMKSSELYDPATRKWSQTGPLDIGRFHHTATLLSGTSEQCGNSCGKVLVAGGYGPNFAPGGITAPTNTAELYDPATGLWTSTGNMGDCAALVPGAPAPATCGARYGHTATLLGGSAEECGVDCGKVMVAGGMQPSPRWPSLKPAQRPTLLYNPRSGSWDSGGPFSEAAEGSAFHSATLLQGDLGQCGVACGNVMAVSGITITVCSMRPERYDPKTRTWARTQTNSPTAGEPGDQGVHRPFHSATLLPSGKVLYAGGNSGINGCISTDKVTPSVEIYDPSRNQWSLGRPLTNARFGHAATQLASGKVLAVGGFNSGPLFSAEVYDAASDSWTSAGAMTSPRGIVDLGLPMDPGCEYGSNPALAGPPRNYCGGGAEAQPIFSTPGPSATLISADPGFFKSDRAQCGEDCGKVLVLGGTKDGAAELYTPAPSITAISPAVGPAAGGTEVTVTGTGFSHDVREVRFGGMPAQSFTVDSYSRLRAVAPASATNASVPITVVNEGGAAESTDVFAYAGAATGGGGSITTSGTGGAQLGAPPSGTVTGPGAAAQVRRARAFRSCLVRAARHTRIDRAATRRGSLRARALARRHLRRHRAAMRRRCVARHGRTPGRVTSLSGRAISKRVIELSFRAPGSDRNRPPPARGYLVKQSRSPITDLRSFRRGQTLCNGTCRFPVTRVGEQLKLKITELRPNTTYYYAVAARDNVTRRLGPRSSTVRTRTR